MGAGAINPFFNVRQSRPMSHFVDESMPAELMLQAGIAKQGQYDKGLQLANMLSSFDQAAIPNSGDETYVKRLQEEFNTFVDGNINKDLSNNQIQAEMFKHIRKIQQDPQLKNVRANLAAYQKLMEDSSELYKKGKRFDPSLNRSLREVQRYASSGEEGGRIGQLGVAEALNLQDKEQSYFEPIQASGGERFVQDFKNFQGLYFKQGSKGVSQDRIGQQVNLAVNDYATSSEGKQALEIYQDMIDRGQQPLDMAGKPITNPGQYLFDRLMRTGTAYVFGQSTVDYNAGLNDRLFPKTDPAAVPVQSPSGTLSLGDIDYQKALIMINDKTLPEAQRAAIQSIIDKARNTVAESPKGKALSTKLVEIGDNLPSFSKEQFLKQLDYTSSPGDAPKYHDKLVSFITDNMDAAVKQNLEAKNNEFFSILNQGSRIGSVLEVNTQDPDNPYVTIQGTDLKLTKEDLGLTAEELASNSTVLTIQNYGRAAKSPYKQEGTAEVTSKVGDILSEYDSLVEAQADGTVTQTSNTWRTVDSTAKGIVEETFRSANFGNITAVNLGNLDEVLSGKSLEDLLANVSAGDISVRADQSNRMLEVTVKTSDGQKTFKVQEKPGLEGKDQTFDRIFQTITGDANAASKAGAVGKFSNSVSNTLTSLQSLTGPYSGALPTGVNPNLTVKLATPNAGLPGQYVIGDSDGVFTMQDLADRMKGGNDPRAMNLVANKFVELANSRSISKEKLVSLMKMLQDDDITQGEYPTADLVLFTDLMNDELSASNYDEVMLLGTLFSF